MNDYDVVIIGSGPAGYTSAFEAAGYNLKTAIIERDGARMGGVCLNEGCIPLKGLLHHSRASGDYNFIRKLVFDRVDQIRSGLKSRLSSKGIEIISGEARMLSKKQISVNGRAIQARFIIIAVGSSPKKIYDIEAVHTSDKIFNMEKVPGQALIIGGGVVGCEYASFLSNIGVGVDIVEMLESPLAGEDEEAVRVMLREFKKKGITVYAGSTIAEIRDGVQVAILSGKREFLNRYDMIFEAVGRKPNTDGLGLEAAGVELTDKGFVRVNGWMQTSADNIYAAGDCIDTPMLAYTAYKEAEHAIRHIATGEGSAIDYSAMPRLVFSMPQVGSVGLVTDKGAGSRTYRFFFKALGKAVMEGKDTGFVKLIADRESGRIIGASAVGDDIADIINMMALIIKSGMKAKDVKDCMFVHPSLSEILKEALSYGYD
jgi:dihydrolipoamide dehydrogenase